MADTRFNNAFDVGVLTIDLPALARAAVAIPLVNVASIGAAFIGHVEALAAVDVFRTVMPASWPCPLSGSQIVCGREA